MSFKVAIIYLGAGDNINVLKEDQVSGGSNIEIDAVLKDKTKVFFVPLTGYDSSKAFTIDSSNGDIKRSMTYGHFNSIFNAYNTRPSLITLNIVPWHN